MNFGKLFRDVANAVAKAMKDAKANRQLPPAPAMTSDDIGAALRQIQGLLPELIAAVDKYPGLIRGADDVLEALRRDGVPWAADLEKVLNEMPAGLAEAEQWLPTIQYWLNAFKPAPGKFTGIA